MLMPAELRKALSDDYKLYLDLALQGKKGPSAKDLRMMAFMKNLYGEYPPQTFESSCQNPCKNGRYSLSLQKKGGVYEYQRISFDIYGRTNRCHAS